MFPLSPSFARLYPRFGDFVKIFTKHLPPFRMDASVPQSFYHLNSIMRTFLSILAAGLAATGTAASAADIIGTVTYKGTPPPEKTITPILDDPSCGALYKGVAPTTHFYVVGANGEFGDVIVSLKDVSSQSAGAGATPLTLDQKGCVYSPTIVTLQTGQKLIVKNSDPVLHNVHLNPTVPENEKANETSINSAQMPGGADLTYAFPKPEKFLKFQCDVHPWMFAWVTIVDSPYYAQTGADGKFVIKNVPPGKYTIVADHRKAGESTQDIEVKDADVTVNFTFEPK
jgi:plastocyanin